MKRQFKIILDIVMLLMMLTLFSKQFIGMQYHEIAGIILIMLIIIHIVINIKTALAMCKKFIKLPPNLKVCLIVDIFLLICFALLGISGILISHTILTEISSDNVAFKMLHIFAGGLSVILLGIHIGLHICRKPMPVVVAVVLSVLAICGGGYGVLKSNELRWLSMLFSSISQPKELMNNKKYNSHNNENMQNEAPKNDKINNSHRQKDISTKGNGNNRQMLSNYQRIENIIMFSGMILSCAMITYWITIPKKKNIINKSEIQ